MDQRPTQELNYKSLRENTGINYDLRLGNGFLDVTLKLQATRVDKLDFIKIQKKVVLPTPCFPCTLFVSLFLY